MPFARRRLLPVQETVCDSRFGPMRNASRLRASPLFDALLTSSVVGLAEMGLPIIHLRSQILHPEQILLGEISGEHTPGGFEFARKLYRPPVH